MHHVVQTKRRTWDIHEYREKALQRQQDSAGSRTGKAGMNPYGHFIHCQVSREDLQARDYKLDFDKSVGQVKVCFFVFSC